MSWSRRKRTEDRSKRLDDYKYVQSEERKCVTVMGIMMKNKANFSFYLCYIIKMCRITKTEWTDSVQTIVTCITGARTDED